MANEKLDILVGVKGARDSDNSLKSVSDILNSVSKTATNVNNVLNTFMQSASKHTADLVNQYKTLNQEILKYQQNLQRVGNMPSGTGGGGNIVQFPSSGIGGITPVVQSGVSSRILTGQSFGGKVFQQRIDDVEERNKRRQENERRVSTFAGRFSNAASTTSGIGQQMAQGDLSGAWQNTLQTSSQAMLGNTFLFIPGAIGLIRAMRDKIITQMGQVYANALSGVSDVTGMTGSFKTGKAMINRGYMLGYNNQEVAGMATAYTRAGGYNVTENVDESMRIARSYGLNANEVASQQGEISRYTGGTKDLRDVMAAGQAGDVRGQMMGEFNTMVIAAWKQAISQGINIKNPEKIATSFAMLNKMGFQGVQGQEMFSSLNQAISSAANVSDPRQIMIMRAIRAQNPQQSFLQSMMQAERGASDPANIRAIFEFQKKRGITGENRIIDYAKQMNISYTNAEQAIRAYDAQQDNVSENRWANRYAQGVEQDRRQTEMSQIIRTDKYRKNLIGEAVSFTRGEAAFGGDDGAENRQKSNLVTMLNVMNESAGAVSRGLDFLKEIVVGNSRNLSENTEALRQFNATVNVSRTVTATRARR